jgi:hypothetical protein
MDWGAKFDPVFRKTWPIRPPDLNSRRKLGERTINVNCAEVLMVPTASLLATSGSHP